MPTVDALAVPTASDTPAATEAAVPSLTQPHVAPREATVPNLVQPLTASDAPTASEAAVLNPTRPHVVPSEATAPKLIQPPAVPTAGNTRATSEAQLHAALIVDRAPSEANVANLTELTAGDTSPDIIPTVSDLSPNTPASSAHGNAAMAQTTVAAPEATLECASLKTNYGQLVATYMTSSNRPSSMALTPR